MCNLRRMMYPINLFVIGRTSSCPWRSINAAVMSPTASLDRCRCRSLLMAPRIKSYLRTHRKKGGLSQDEMAFLLGYQSGTKISRFERLARHPNLETALACQVVFGIPAHKLFPGVFAKVEKTVTERARLLSDQLRSQRASGRSGLRNKLAILKAIAAERQPNDNDA
jgi:transcriptional regulator with XRE-family HTH domain